MKPKQPLTLANCNPAVIEGGHPWTLSESFLRGLKYLGDPTTMANKRFAKLYFMGAGALHSGGHKPLTFIRQVMSLTLNPQLMDTDIYPEDVKERVRTLYAGDPNFSLGSYTSSLGWITLRKQICKFIEERDGIAADPGNIIAGDGATSGITLAMEIVNKRDSSRPVGVLVPVPYYIVFPSLAGKLGMEMIPYYLDEDNNWSVTTEELERVVREAETRCHPRLLVVINPGNPTGAVFTKEAMQDMIKFAYQEQLVLLADEVYQKNVYFKEVQWYSFKKVLAEMDLPYSQTQIISVMCASKGCIGECGLRAGYCEMLNFEKDLIDAVMPYQLARMCPNTAGQAVMYSALSLPREGEPSYPLFYQESSCIMETLKKNAILVTERLNKIKGFSCTKIVASLYAFPRVMLPPKYIARAEKLNKHPDNLYTLDLLEKTGICLSAGIVFGEKPGTYHLRLTIVDSVAFMTEVLDILEKFQEELLAEYQ